MDAIKTSTSRSGRYAFLALLVSLFAACAVAPPVQEMSDARQAIRAAVDANATTHAPDTLSRAERLMDEATRRLEEGRYDSARHAAMRAREEAMRARDLSLGGQSTPATE